MKNFPHQISDLEKLYQALLTAKHLIDLNIPLTDQNFGELLTTRGIYTYRDKNLSIEEYLDAENLKPASSRGYLTVSRDIRRFFELMGFITVERNKQSRINPNGSLLINAEGTDKRNDVWKNSFLQLALQDEQGNVSHPYRILLKLINKYPGITTSNLMLALEAKSDSEEEFARISNLALLNLDDILATTGTSEAMARNAVKILPGIAEQLGDLVRRSNRTYPVSELLITEDEITSNALTQRAQYKATDSSLIAKDPTLNFITSSTFDLGDAIRLRQIRLKNHQEIVRALASKLEKEEFNLYEGKFDCLGIRDDKALLFEIKTITDKPSDIEKQIVKGVGQLKFYKFDIVQKQMKHENVISFLVFSCEPPQEYIEFCQAENIIALWIDKENFLYKTVDGVKVFNGVNFL